MPDETALNNQDILYRQYLQTQSGTWKGEDNGTVHKPASPGPDSNVQFLLHQQSAASQQNGEFVQYLEDVFHDLFPDISDEDADLLLVAAIGKLKDVQTALGNLQIKVTAKLRETFDKQKAAALEESRKKTEEAASKHKDVEIWSKIKLAFEWIGAAIAIGVGVGLMVLGAAVPGVSLLGGLLLGVGLLALLGAIDSTTSTLSSSKLGVARNLWLAVGVNKDTAANLDLAAKIYGALLTTAIAVAMLWLPPAEMSIAAQWMQLASSIATISIDAGTVAGDTVANVYNYQATMAQADAQDIQADAKTFEADASILEAFVEEKIKQIGNLFDRFNDMLETVADAINARNTEILHITFTA
jgi:hypothetical protein